MEYKKLSKGMGEAIAKRTVLRMKENGELENWGDVAERVSVGNTSLTRLINKDKEWIAAHIAEEQKLLQKHIANGVLLMSGRHLQHGDENQLERNMEVFTNCSTATTSFLLFYLLLNGSGVGRAYDDDMCLVNWDYAPDVRVVLAETHPDFVWGEDESLKEAQKKYKDAKFIEVEDSREGWAKVIEIIEVMAFSGSHKSDLLIFDFSHVRPKGSPIAGMQKRPSSGPKPTMNSIKKAMSIKGSGMAPWKQAMWIDHYLAECVLVGGARRSARMSTKWWRDRDIIEFINIKRGGFLWSSNNSIAVDSSFWKQDTDHKKTILNAALAAAYNDQTGEPGFINQDKLIQNDEGLEEFFTGDYVGSKKYKLKKESQSLLAEIAKTVKNKKYTQITNPCGEISLSMLGGYCVIADVVPYHAKTKDEILDAFRVVTRALIRVNLMDSLYNKEVKRTNRIGVGMTGIHEYAWSAFGLGFYDLIDETKSQEFWNILKEFNQTVNDEAVKYSDLFGLKHPHTTTTIKPAGTTSKLFGLTEGAHLPSMKEYLRWVQFRNDDPLVWKYKELGYPTKELKNYHGTTAIGFPTQPEICRLKMGLKLVTAAKATPDEQYKWIILLEKYWLNNDKGNQVSYTLKYKPDLVSFKHFVSMITQWQPQVRCCTVMPQIDVTSYEYQPEEPISGAEFVRIVDSIKDSNLTEDIDLESLRCASGACPL